jgi:flavodoxin
MIAKEIKEEMNEEDFVIDDLSDLIDELSDLVSENECLKAVTKTIYDNKEPFGTKLSQYLSPIKETHEEQSMTPFAIHGLKVSDLKEYSSCDLDLDNMEELICAPDSSSVVSDDIGALI